MINIKNVLYYFICMENCLHKLRLFPAALLLGGLLLAGCVNSDYDFNEIDSTMGFGGDGLELPSSSTDTIKLVDVLDLNEDDCVKVRPNGDYVFEQTGDSVDPSRPRIDPIRVAQRTADSYEISVTVTSSQAVAGARAVAVELSADGDMQAFEYDGDKPEEVVELISAMTDAGLSFSLNFPEALRSATPTIDRIEIRMPSYMTLGDIVTNGTYTISGSALTFTDVPTSRNLTLTATIANMEFGVSDDLGSLAVNGDKINLDGRVHVTLSTTATIEDPSTSYIMLSSTFNIDDFEIKSVTGRFDPAIDMDDLGNVEITGVPDFLTEENVRVDLYNPQIFLTITSDMSLDGFVSGTLTSIKDGAETASVVVPEMPIRAGDTTRVCICRTDEGIDRSAYDHVEVVPNLSELIEEIPDLITFAADARADVNSVCTFELDHEYTVRPDYNIEAPIAFAENARIVYKDTLDDWNGDISDFELSENSHIDVTANIENRVPAYLTLSAHAIDVDGNEMGEDQIAVEVSNTVIASPEGQTSVDTPISIRLSQNAEGAMKRLDGLVLSIEAAASDGASAVVGETLNSERHFLIAKDIKIKLVGKLIGDFN